MDMVPVIWQRRLTVWQKSRRFLICLAGGILYILLTDAFSLGYERNSTKFAINCSLSADVVIQSVSRTTYFSVTQLNNKKIYPAETCRVLKCLTHFEIKDNTKHCLQNAYTKMSLPNVNSCCLFLAVKTKMSVPAV